MSDEVDASLGERAGKTSPWPLFVALGVAVSEVGVVLGLFPVTVGGLLLFGGTVAAILRESGYVPRDWHSLAVLGAALLAIGVVAVLAAVGASPTVSVLTDPTRPIAYRATAVAFAGLLLLGAALVRWGVPRRP